MSLWPESLRFWCLEMWLLETQKQGQEYEQHYFLGSNLEVSFLPKWGLSCGITPYLTPARMV